MTSILPPYTADILDFSKLILIISHRAEGGRVQSLCHRFVVNFTIIIWSFGVAAAQHDAPPIDQQMIKPRSSETGYHADLGTFRTLVAAKRASHQLQHWLGQNAINLWLYITPATVDGRARFRLQSDTLQLDE